MNLRSLFENDDELPQTVVAQFLDQLESEQAGTPVIRDDVTNSPENACETLIDETGNVLPNPQLNEKVLGGDNSHALEIPIDNDAPVDIAIAITKLEEKNRYVVEIRLNLNKSDEIKKLQASFNSTTLSWYQFAQEYSLHCKINRNDNTRNAVFIPVPHVCNAFSLAQKIINSQNIRLQDIFFYQVANGEIVEALNDAFIDNHIRYTYAEVAKEIKFECYNKLLIKFNKSNIVDKSSFDAAFRPVINKFKDLKYVASASNNEYQVEIIGAENATPVSLNSYYSLYLINDELRRLAKSSGNEISVTLYKSPKHNYVHISSIEAQPKKQRVEALAPLSANNTSLNILMKFNGIFQNTNIPASLISQFEQSFSQTGKSLEKKRKGSR